MQRLDDLENGFFLYQDPEAFCFGIDAVLLSHFPRLKSGDRVMDLCCGNGIIPILLAARSAREERQIHVTGLEIQEGAAHLAQKSVEYNHLSDQIRILKGDVREAAAIFGAASFSLVTCNPPYMTADTLRAENEARAIARSEVLLSLPDVVRTAAYLLKPGGRCAFIYRPARLVDLLSEMRARKLEPKRLRMVKSFADAAPSMVLVEGVRQGRPHLLVEEDLVIYRDKGVYTDEVLHIYGKDVP